LFTAAVWWRPARRHVGGRVLEGDGCIIEERATRPVRLHLLARRGGAPSVGPHPASVSTTLSCGLVRFLQLPQLTKLSLVDDRAVVWSCFGLIW
jgi:hypothetical protein